MVKNLPAMWETRVQSLGREDPLEKKMVTHSSILAWKFHGQRSLMGYSSWGHKESGTTERTHYIILISGCFFFFLNLNNRVKTFFFLIGLCLITKLNLTNFPG